MWTILSAKPNQSSTPSIQSANSAWPSMSLKTLYCPCLISHSTAIHNFRRVPKMLPNKWFKSGGGIFNGNTGIFRRHSDCLWLLPLLPLLLLLFFFSFSFVRFWQARRSKGALLPPQATNRSLDSSQISRDRFLTRRVISLSLISRDLVARDLVTPLLYIYTIKPYCIWYILYLYDNNILYMI